MITPGLAGAARLLACPVCGGAFEPGKGCLRCLSGHSFDISRKGYVNLTLSKPAQTYDKAMMSARRDLALAGLWDGALEEILSLCGAMAVSGPALDAGCGEGSLLARLMGMGAGIAPAAGIDISKDAAALAAAAYKDICWVAGDLSRAPFRDGCFGLILNILSPARYREFSRLLEAGGTLIKALPGEDYLQELRGAFLDVGRAAYSPRRVEERFAEYFDIISAREVRYLFHAGPGLLPSLAEMSPLGWNADSGKKAALVSEGGMDVTVHMKLLAGRAKAGL